MHYGHDKVLTPLKNTCFLELFITYNFILNYFKIKVMAPQTSVNILYGSTKKFKIGQDYILYSYLNLYICPCSLGGNNPTKPHYFKPHFDFFGVKVGLNGAEKSKLFL